MTNSTLDSDTCTHLSAISTLQTSIASLITIVVCLSTYIWLKRRFVKHQLESIMPTVLWTPRFINYTSREDESERDSFQQRKKMPSSSITNILPKMERLNGPYGMYATVYGLTKVVHVGHPVPAREILNGVGVGKSNTNADGAGVWKSLACFVGRPFRFMQSCWTGTENRQKSLQRRRSSTLIDATGTTKNPAYDHFKNFSGDGVFTANGVDWKEKRASVLHCLLGNINELENEVNKSADGLMQEIKEIQSDEVVNVVPLLQRCTIGLIYRIITHDDALFDQDTGNDGSETNTVKSSSPRSSATSLASLGISCREELKSETASDSENSSTNSHIFDGYQATKPKTNQIKALLPLYLDSVTQIRMIILAQSRSIWYLLPRWVYRLFSPMYREEEAVMGPIRVFARLACQNAKSGSPLELLSKRASHNENTRIMDGVSKDLLDEAITLLFAGQDTSAATLSWTLHLLSLDPAKQQRVVDEVRSILDSDDNPAVDFVSKTMVAQMPYLDAVIKESMRLYPVAPFVVRKLTADITIPGEEASDTTIPESTFACVWIYALHRNPKLWHLPEEFLPERWLDPKLRERDAGQYEPGAYIPFAMGPRNCLGRPLAQVILRVLLARILNRYSVVDPRYEALNQGQKHVDSDIDIKKCLRKDMQAGFTVLPSNGLMLRFVERAQ
jgi:cytochrome P450